MIENENDLGTLEKILSSVADLDPTHPILLRVHNMAARYKAACAKVDQQKGSIVALRDEYTRVAQERNAAYAVAGRLAVEQSGLLRDKAPSIN